MKGIFSAREGAEESIEQGRGEMGGRRSGSSGGEDRMRRIAQWREISLAFAPTNPKN